MKRFSVLLLILFTFFASAAWPQAQTPTPPSNLNRMIPRFPRKPGVPKAQQFLRRAEAARLPAIATRDVVLVQCPPEAQALGAVCGYVNVPLDRKNPVQGTVPINFELYTHTSSGPAESAILVNHGGPGLTTTGFRDTWLSLFGQNLDVHDLLLVDDRGRGLSGTIDCEELQHGTGSSYDHEVADCAAQLGNAASRYGTGDIAKDTEAVRAAIGYDKVDYYGVSYGGADVTAYATRFGDHLRSIVLDAPVGTPGLAKAFALDQYRAHAEPLMVSLDCQRSPTCSPDHAVPQAELDALIWTVMLSPVEGDAYDANGNLMHVRIDENALLNYVIDNPTGLFSSTGEILAAANSLWQGDSKPLLRLGAEDYFPILGDSGDPTYFSGGAELATLCVDQTQAYDWSKPVSERKKQLAAAVAALPFGYFAPFSKQVGAGLLFSIGNRSCLDWEKPTPSSPVAPPQPTYSLAPTLVLTGDIDNRVPTPEVSKVAALFPSSTLVPVVEAGHGTVFWTRCAANLASEFIETLQLGDISCTRTPETVWPAVGRFPVLAKFARPAEVDPNGQNQIGVAERKVVTVAVATATDALQRSIIGSGTGVGLRAGTFQTNYGSSWTTTLTGCAFATDVTVNGTVTWGSDNSLVADLIVSGPGTAGGTLHVEGWWMAGIISSAHGSVGNFNISGTLGGKQVAVLVPNA
jgi:pimeloyl-ACP methyl ester carboxylesterase